VPEVRPNLEEIRVLGQVNARRKPMTPYSDERDDGTARISLRPLRRQQLPGRKSESHRALLPQRAQGTLRGAQSLVREPP
jgi:hypothetical protein